MSETKLKKVIKIKQLQFDSLENGSMVGTETEIQPDNLYFVQPAAQSTTGLFTNCEVLGYVASISKATSSSATNEVTVNLSRPISDFELICIAMKGGGSTYAFQCIPSCMWSLYRGGVSYPYIVLKGETTDYGIVAFNDPLTAKAACYGNAHNLYIWGVNL